VDDTPPFVGEQDMRRTFFLLMAIAFSARQGPVRALQAAKESRFASSRSLTTGFFMSFLAFVHLFPGSLHFFRFLIHEQMLTRHIFHHMSISSGQAVKSRLQYPCLNLLIAWPIRT
jgi:hypothetical protein